MRALIIAGILAAGLIGWNYPEEKIEYRYEVEEGDTVWDIASRIATPREDVREIAYDIIKENNIKNAVITPGQVLIIRVAKQANGQR